MLALRNTLESLIQFRVLTTLGTAGFFLSVIYDNLSYLSAARGRAR
jgi:hypothetical protein